MVAASWTWFRLWWGTCTTASSLVRRPHPSGRTILAGWLSSFTIFQRSFVAALLKAPSVLWTVFERMRLLQNMNCSSSNKIQEVETTNLLKKIFITSPLTCQLCYHKWYIMFSSNLLFVLNGNGPEARIDTCEVCGARWMPRGRPKPLAPFALCRALGGSQKVALRRKWNDMVNVDLCRKMLGYRFLKWGQRGTVYWCILI